MALFRKLAGKCTVEPQPWQTGRILVAAEVGVMDKMFTSLVVLRAYLTIFNCFWMLICWKEEWSLTWVADTCFFLRSYLHFWAEAANLAVCSKLCPCHSQNVGTTVHLISVVQCIGMQCGTYEPLSCCKTKAYQFIHSVELQPYAEMFCCNVSVACVYPRMISSC